MILVKNKIIPFGKYKAINLFGIVFYKGSELTDTQIRHEKIHTKQIIELIFILFYLIYVIEWIVRGFNYYGISFEKEAYKHQDDEDYLSNRKHYSMWRK